MIYFLLTAIMLLLAGLLTLELSKFLQDYHRVDENNFHKVNAEKEASAAPFSKQEEAFFAQLNNMLNYNGTERGQKDIEQ